jgi:hypothetical protein
MILIADASALIALATCDQLELLDQLFGSVLVPPAVFAEVTVSGRPQSGRLQTYLTGKVHRIDLHHFVQLDAFADLGETQAMQLYKQLAADFLLIDDKRGRRIARINQIRAVGSLGVLLQAKRVGLIDRIAPALADIAASPVHISETLRATVLSLAGESEE